MFKHVAAFKLATDDAELKGQQAKEFAELIQNLGAIPGLISMEVGIDRESRLSFTTSCSPRPMNRLQALEAYQAHPTAPGRHRARQPDRRRAGDRRLRALTTPA